jgi:hypothetical protein
LTFDLSSPILYVLGVETAVKERLDEQVREKTKYKLNFEMMGILRSNPSFAVASGFRLPHR